jgi:hypothetical protein
LQKKRKKNVKKENIRKLDPNPACSFGWWLMAGACLF